MTAISCFRLVYGDHRETLPAGTDKPAQNADVSLTLSVDNGVHTITLTPVRSGVRLVALECDMALPERLFEPAHELYVYNNNAYTNDVTAVSAYAESDPPRSIREMAVWKNQDNRAVFLAGYLTSHRFWASVIAEKRSLTFRFELEERLLQEGEVYTMERFMTGEGTDCENALLERYADGIDTWNQTAKRAHAPLPVGWCSWSCYYTKVDEEKIRRAADAQTMYGKNGIPNLVQIDDGWQGNGSFCGEWLTDETKFPHGMAETARYVTDRGLVFGLWLAPLLLNETSEHYESLKSLAMPERTLRTAHPFNLGNPQFLEHLKRTFRRMVDEYGARYFKLDFLAAAVRHFNGCDDFIRFPDGFSIECLRRALQTIRNTVGDEVFLVSCGAPLLVGAGIFNGARMSCDIIWGKSPTNPSFWTIMQNCLHTVAWRYFYHRKVYVNDPDGLVLRDVDVGDGFNCTYSEAELWAIAVAMSGGAVLSNDELENLSPARRRLYQEILPPLDKPCHPVDYFAQPVPDAYILPVDERTAFLALYHYSDGIGDMSFDLDRIGMKGALAADCLAHRFIGFTDKLEVPLMNPHSAAMFLLRMPSDQPEFVGADTDIYQGIHRFSSSFADGHLHVTCPDGVENPTVYALYPDGFTPEGEAVLQENGYTLTKLS